MFDIGNVFVIRNSVLVGLCSCVCCFVRFLIIKHTYSHGGSTLAFHSGSVPPHTPTQSGWNLIIPYWRSRHSKPTTVSSRSNQKLALKRLWNGALHSPQAEVCCIRRQIFTHCAKVQSRLRQVSLYLITAPRNTGGITRIFISLSWESRSEEEWTILLTLVKNVCTIWSDLESVRDDRIARYRMEF